MTKKKKILILAEGVSTAHPTRMWELINYINDPSFEIHFATAKPFHSLLENNPSVKIHELKTIPNTTFNERLFNIEFPFTLEELQQFSQDDAALIEQIKPDLLIADFRLSIFNSAKKFNIPLINLVQYHWHPRFKKEKMLPYVKPVQILGRHLSNLAHSFVSPFIQQQQLKLINQFQEMNQQKIYNTVYDFYCDGDYLVFPDIPSLFPESSLAPNERFIGPLIWKNKKTEWPSSWPTDFLNTKTVYLTMGSTGNHKMGPALITALKQNGFQILLSTSGHPYKQINQEGIYTSPFVPADEVLKKVDLIVCNGGTSTTYHGLSRKVPVFAIPANMDQHLHTNQLKKKYLADTENPDDFNSTRFIDKINKLLNSQKTHQELHQAAVEIEQLQTDNKVKALIDSLLKSSHP